MIMEPVTTATLRTKQDTTGLDNPLTVSLVRVLAEAAVEVGGSMVAEVEVGDSLVAEEGRVLLLDDNLREEEVEEGKLLKEEEEEEE